MNHYQILELNNTATPQDIKKAYYRLAKIWHPDKNPDNENEATEKFKLIQHAYEVLSDPVSKKRYDSLFGIHQEDSKKENNNRFSVSLSTLIIKYPGLLSTLNTENYFEKIKQYNLSREEISFLWFKAINDRYKILASIHSWDDFSLIPSATDYIFYTNVNNFYEYRKTIIELKIFHKCIKTMDDLMDFLCLYYLGIDDFAQTYKYTLCNELEYQFPKLIQGGLKKYLYHDKFLDLLYSLSPNSLSVMARWNKKEFLRLLHDDEADEQAFLNLLSHCDFNKEKYTITLFSSSSYKSLHSSHYSVVLRKNEKSEIEFIPGLGSDQWKPSKLALSEGALKVLDAFLEHENPITLNYSDNPELFRQVLFQCIPRVKFDKEQALALAQELLPAQFKSTGLLVDKIKNLPAPIALFALKKISMVSFRLRHDQFSDMLTWPAFSEEKNKIYRDELSNYLLDNEKDLLAQKKLFYALFFHFSKEVQAKFLAMMKEKYGPTVKEDWEFLVYSAWGKNGLAEKEVAMKAISFPPLNVFLMDLPSNIPQQDLYLLANALIKSTALLDILIANDTFRFPSFLVPHRYKEIFKDIESQARKELALKDNFIEKLDEKICYYTNQHNQEVDGSENKLLYADMIKIFKIERNQYAVSARDHSSKSNCCKIIADRINQLTTTSIINENTADILSRGVYSIGSLFGLCQAKDVIKKTPISNNMHTFMSHPHTRLVKDIVEACELKSSMLH